jgi:hypothetical protein
VEAVGEESGSEDGLLGESGTFQGEEFLRIDGLVEGHQVFAEMGHLLEVFEEDDRESGSGEAVFAGIPGRAVLAFRGAGAGGLGGVGAISGELLRGNGIRHEMITLRFEDGMEGGLTPKLDFASDGEERSCS